MTATLYDVVTDSTRTGLHGNFLQLLLRKIHVDTNHVYRINVSSGFVLTFKFGIPDFRFGNRGFHVRILMEL